MRGIVFTKLSDLIVDNFGMGAWQRIIDQSSLPSEGVYTAGKFYDDSEIETLLIAIEKNHGLNRKDSLNLFGEYLLKFFSDNFGSFFERADGLLDFLMSVETVIHQEVRKMYDEARLPSFDCNVVSDSELIMLYRSERKLCHLAEGLINGAGKYYGVDVSLEHRCCQLEGAGHCELRLEVTDVDQQGGA